MMTYKLHLHNLHPKQYHILYIPRTSITWLRVWDDLKDFRFEMKRSDHEYVQSVGVV